MATESENYRSNAARERENFRHNSATEHQAQSELEESKRHALVAESQTDRQIAETGRHNLVSESQNQQAINETGRHNRATESQAVAELGETERHNRASEHLTKRGQDVDYKKTTDAAKINASANRDSASISANATKESAQTAADATKYSADKHAEASKYNSDVMYQNNKDRIKADKTLTRMNNRTSITNAREANAARKDIATFNKLFVSADVSAENKAQAERYQKQLDEAATKREWDTFSSLYRTYMGFLGEIFPKLGN